MAKGQNVVCLICPCLQGNNYLPSSRKQEDNKASLSWTHISLFTQVI